jgi:hypothetical protein
MDALIKYIPAILVLAAIHLSVVLLYMVSYYLAFGHISSLANCWRIMNANSAQCTPEENAISVICMCLIGILGMGWIFFIAGQICDWKDIPILTCVILGGFAMLLFGIMSFYVVNIRKKRILNIF